MSRYLFCILLLLVLNSPLFAQEQDPIGTDRPSQAPSAALLSPGILQFESGIIYRSFPDIKTTSLNSLWRLGVNENFELRAFIDYSFLNRELDGSDGNESSWAPLQLGTKVRISEQNGWIPQTAFVAMVYLPSGEGSLQINRALPDLRLTFANDIPGALDVFYSLGVLWTPGDFKAVGLYTLGLGITLSSRVWSFVEFYGYFNDFVPDPSLNGGITWLITNDIKFDLTAGFDFPESGGAFVSSGVSFRVGR